MELPSSLVHKMFIMSLATADAFVIFRFYSGISIRKEKFQENKKPRRSSPWTIIGQCCQTSWSEHESCRIVSVCAQNVSGMVSELSPGLKEPVIYVYRVSCPPPHSHYSAKTRRLHLQPHSILSNSLQTRTILEQRAGLWAGVHRLGGAQTGGNDWGLTERGKRRVWRETLGPSINPSELCFPLAQSGSAATVSLGHSRHSPVTTLRWSLCEVRWNYKSRHYLVLYIKNCF